MPSRRQRPSGDRRSTRMPPPAALGTGTRASSGSAPAGQRGHLAEGGGIEAQYRDAEGPGGAHEPVELGKQIRRDPGCRTGKAALGGHGREAVEERIRVRLPEDRREVEAIDRLHEAEPHLGVEREIGHEIVTRRPGAHEALRRALRRREVEPHHRSGPRLTLSRRGGPDHADQPQDDQKRETAEHRHTPLGAAISCRPGRAHPGQRGCRSRRAARRRLARPAGPRPIRPRTPARRQSASAPRPDAGRR